MSPIELFEFGLWVFGSLLLCIACGVHHQSRLCKALTIGATACFTLMIGIGFATYQPLDSPCSDPPQTYGP